MPTKKQSSVKNKPLRGAQGKFRHHAYLINGAPDAVLPALMMRLEEELGTATRGHPDIFLHRASVFSIADSRQVRAEDRGRPIVSESKFIILAAEFFTPEAQHALLKTLEDAAPDTHYFLIAPQTEKLLPTLRSRLEKMKFPKFPTCPTCGEEFLAFSLSERLAFVGKLVEERKDDEDSGLLKKEVSELLNSLEIILHKNLHDTSNASRNINARGLEEVIRARDYLADRGAMVKMILENLALVLPER